MHVSFDMDFDDTYGRVTVEATVRISPITAGYYKNTYETDVEQLTVKSAEGLDISEAVKADKLSLAQIEEEAQLLALDEAQQDS